VATYVALFRGINVGGNNILPMKELVALLEGMDYERVQTYIQSGNVVFRAENEPGPEDLAELGRRVLDSRGFQPKIMLLSGTELLSAVAKNPFDSSDGKALHFFFLDSAATEPDIDRLESLRAHSEAFALRDRVFYLHAPDGVGRSKLAPGVEKALGVSVTARNWNTVSKLVSMADQISEASRD